MKPKNVILCSGGLDSTVVIAELVKSHKKPTLFFCDIGARASKQELIAIYRIARYYSLPVVQVRMDIPFLNSHAMFDKGKVIFQAVQGFKLATSEENLYHEDWLIPLRNLFLLSAAATYCEYESIKTLYTGFNNPGAVSRDAQAAFIQAFNNMLSTVTERLQSVLVIAPLQLCNKMETIDRGFKVDAPMHLSYTCYNGFDKSCGICPNCHSRLLAFKRLNKTDPVAYYTEKELRWIFGNKHFDEIMSTYDTEGLDFPRITQHESSKS